jgi:hypothetical protein
MSYITTRIRIPHSLGGGAPHLWQSMQSGVKQQGHERTASDVGALVWPLPVTSFPAGATGSRDWHEVCFSGDSLIKKLGRVPSGPGGASLTVALVDPGLVCVIRGLVI